MDTQGAASSGSGTTRTKGRAQKFFARWFWRATHSRLPLITDVGKLIRRHLPNVLMDRQHRNTNAGLEAVNATIQGVEKTGLWLRNVDHFKTAIYFHCGGLDLYLYSIHTKA